MRLIKVLLFAFFVFAIAAPAQATILFAGGEDIDVAVFGTVTVDTTASHFRSGYARAALSISGVAGDPNFNRAQLPVFASQSTVWLHAETFTTNGTVNGDQLAAAYGSDGVRRLIIRGTGGANQVKISTRNTAGTITDLVTCTAGVYPLTNSLAKVDWFINYAVMGSTILYVNGVNVCSFTGDVTTNGVTALNQFELGGLSGTVMEWSEFIIATTDTRDMNLLTCAPQANGNTMAWTGSFSNVNPTTINDTSSISTSSNAQIAEFTCPSPPAGAFTVPAVSQSVRMTVGASGPQHFRYIARPSSGSTNYDNGSDVAGSGTYANYYNIWATNPAGGSWGTGDLGAGVNFGLESEP